MSCSVKRAVMCCGQFQSNVSRCSQNAFELSLVIRRGDERGQSRIGVERKGFDAGIDFEPRGAGVIHEEQARPVVGREVAGADVLAVATVVGESEGAIVEELEETARTAPVLDIRPTGLRNRRHVEAVARSDERRFVLGEPIELAVPLEVLPDAIDAHFGLHGPDAGRRGNIEKSV
jgi:hypothetical protein